jgi:hypothetical protein
MVEKSRSTLSPFMMSLSNMNGLNSFRDPSFTEFVNYSSISSVALIRHNLIKNLALHSFDVFSKLTHKPNRPNGHNR